MRIGPLVRILRPAHWAKNVFVLAPLVFAQLLGDRAAMTRALVAFVTYCFASSAVYIFNDIRDRDRDRHHPVKKARPLPSGELGVGTAAAVSVLLGTVSVAGALALGGAFLAVLATYLALNVLYSVWLKRVVIVDVMSVAAGFVLRVLGGGVAVGVEISAWLLLCTVFLALFLAFSKRRHELLLLDESAPDQRQVLTSYNPVFLDQMINVVTASTVVAYALYSISPETVEKFHTGLLVYTIPFVLFGIFRYLYLIYQMPSRLNPTEAVLRDAPSLVNLLLWGATVVWIVYLA